MKYFANTLCTWYAAHGRHDLPWRQTQDAYRIWLSEIILQQTRVAQGMDYYLRFVERFPTVQQLAAASEDEVLRLWQGLGYYSRARNLLCAARQVEQLGAFPTHYKAVRQLKGVGDYTAAAICSFAYNQPHAVVDGNVFRLLTRHFGIALPIDTAEGKREVTTLAQQLLAEAGANVAPRDYNSAIMDFGALVCSAKQSQCEVCPFAASCYAYAHKSVAEFPKKSKRVAIGRRFMVYVYLCMPDGGTWLHRRKEHDIWAGLYEPLLLEFDEQPTDAEVVECLSKRFNLSQMVLQKRWEGVKHQLTHRLLHIDFWTLTAEEPFTMDDFVAVDRERRETLATPRVVQQFYEWMEENKVVE